MRPDPRGKNRRGSALILVLWCLIIMTMAVLGLIALIELSVEHSSHDQLALEARALASSGLALGLNPQLQKDDPLLAQTTAPGRSYRVVIGSEGARLNLNFLLLNRHKEVLENLFTTWGLTIDEAERAADCLYDWVTPGDLRSLNGAKDGEYDKLGLPQRPTHAPFKSFDEVLLVLGMDEVAKARPNWRDSFTIWSEGPLDLTEAPADLIAALTGIAPSRAEFFVKTRNGLDETPGTADDVPVKSLKEFQAAIGLSDLAAQGLSGQVSFGDPTRRVESTGQALGVRVTISVVTQLKSSPVRYYSWTER